MSLYGIVLTTAIVFYFLVHRSAGGPGIRNRWKRAVGIAVTATIAIWLYSNRERAEWLESIPARFHGTWRYVF